MIVQIFNEDQNTWLLCLPVRKYGAFEQKEDFENTWFVCLLDMKYGTFEQKLKYELGLRPKWCHNYISI